MSAVAASGALPVSNLLPAPVLPKGGGAVHGLGEQFSVQEQTGSCSLHVPLGLSPGRGASNPVDGKLSLTYQHGGGRSVFGWSWQLGMPYITRSTRHQLPTYTDEDTFEFAGDELVPLLEPPSWQPYDKLLVIDGVPCRIRRFRSRTDNAEHRVEFCTPTGGESFWRMVDRNNVITTYGRTANSRIADPAGAWRIAQWLPEETRDDRGNVVRYEYKGENTAGVTPEPGEQHRLGVAQANRYLKRIRYSNATPDDPTTTRMLIVLDYGEHDLAPDEVRDWLARPDPYSDCRAGFEVRTWRLCRRVLMFHDFGPDSGPGPLPRLVKAVELGYRLDPIASLLTSITQRGYLHDGAAYRDLALPPLELQYSNAQQAAGTLRFTAVDGIRTRFVDLDGDGLPGVLSSHPGGWWYQRPAGNGQFDPPRVLSSQPVMARAGGPQLADADGSGRLAEVVEAAGGVAGTTLRSGSGWERFRPWTNRSNQDLATLRRSDLTGDSLPDLVQLGPDQLTWTESSGRDGYGRSHRRAGVGAPAADSGHQWFLADLTGDGLADLVQITDGSVRYRPNLGRGRYGEQIVMGGAPEFGAGFDAARLRLADLTGTGTSDLVYLGAVGVNVWHNESGVRWSGPVSLGALPRVRNLDDIQVLDLMGAGTPCLVWLSSGLGQACYLDLAASGPARQLTAIVNNLGATTTISYASSAAMRLADRRLGRPWATQSSGAVSVVERVELVDAVADTITATRYHYRDGYFDTDERESRGFGQVDSYDADSGAAPVLTRHWFHQGRASELTDTFALDSEAIQLSGPVLEGVGSGPAYRQALRALAGQLLRSEVYADSAVAPYTVEQFRHRVVQLQPGDPAAFAFRQLEAITHHYERTLDDPRVTHDLTLDFDPYGNPVSVVKVAYPRRIPQAEEQEPALVSWTLTELANDDQPTRRRLGVPIRTRQYEVSGLAVPPAGFSIDSLPAGLAGLVERDYASPPTPGLAERRLANATRYEYWSDSQGAALPPGQLGSRALVRRVLRFAMSPGLVSEVYGANVTAGLLTQAGYESIDGLWWVSDGILGYDPGACCLLVRQTSPFGNVASVTYDSHHLLVAATSASAAAPFAVNTQAVVNDYRALAPARVTDANGVEGRVSFDELGRVTESWLIGSDGSGDTPAFPGIVHTYGSDSWLNGIGPAWSHTSKRERHGVAGSRWQQQRLYVDGLGRIAMTKTQAEPGDAWVDDGAGGVVLMDTTPNVRWVGSGRTVFNHKGMPIEQYEPYFATTVDFDTADSLVKHTVTQRRTYDPLGRLTRADYPDGTLETIEIGPWREVHADRNDTVLISSWFTARQAGGTPAPQVRAATLAAAHAGTPTVSVTDPLGRVVRIIADNGPDGLRETRHHLDLADNIVGVDDARGVRCVTQMVDAAGRILRTDSIDAGVQRALPDTLGLELRHWPAGGQVVSCEYDLLRRLVQVGVQESGTDRLVEYTVYGETHPQAGPRGLIGRMHRRYDGAGASRAERYDLHGNLIEGARQLLVGTANWTALVGQPLAALDALEAPSLDLQVFTAGGSFDALSNPIRQLMPDGTEVSLSYGDGGLLSKVSARLAGAAASTPFVDGIDYDARRHRTAVRYPTGVTSSYDYDPDSGKLTDIQSRQGSLLLQDLHYTHDPAGNVVQTEDGAAQVTFFAGAVVRPGNLYSYDPTYQLLTATGREHASLSVGTLNNDPSLPPLPHPNDASAIRTYTESYHYDSVGNILESTHSASGSSWTRHYQYAAGSNRLAAHQLPGDPAGGPYSGVFDHDAAGNVTRTPQITSLAWNHAGKLDSADLGGGGVVGFRYDNGGNRVHKIRQHHGTIREERIYLGNYELFRRYRSGVLFFERATVHIMDGSRRVALVETVTVDSDHPGFDGSARQRFQLADQLGSSALETDQAGNVLSYEEYHPYGSTALWLARGAASASTRRYRYLGKERDEETGLCSFGSRYYASWLGRWLSPDLAGLADGVNRYSYVNNNPVRMADPTGFGGVEPEQMWLSELRALWFKVKATPSGKFAQSHYDYAAKLAEMWGGAPKNYVLGHAPEAPLWSLKAGAISEVGIQSPRANATQSIGERVAAGLARARGEFTRFARRTAEWVKDPPKGQPKLPEIGGIKPTPPVGPALTPPFTPKPPMGQVPLPFDAGKPGAPPSGQLQLSFGKPPPQSTQLELSLGKADAAAGTAKAAGTATQETTAIAKTAAPAVQETTAIAKTAAPATQDAAAVAKSAAPVTQDTAAVAKTAAPVVQDSAAVAKSAAPIVQDTTAIAKTAAPVAQDTAAMAKTAAPVLQDVKSLAPVVKSAEPVIKETGTLSKVIGGGAKVLKTVAPALRVVGEVLKPLAVATSTADLATANNNTDRLVAAGDLSAGVAMYCGPVGEAFSVGYTAGGLVDKGISYVSTKTVGVDLSPSAGVATSMNVGDKLVSAVIPDDSSKPAYKNENKVAWFLIDTLGF